MMRHIWLLAAYCFSCMAAAQTCLNGAVVTTPVEDFVELANGDVVHLPTQLVWQRCALGQAWSGEACTGEPMLVTWPQALNAALEVSASEAQPWRLPNIKELMSLVERSCVRPAINTTLFAGTPPDDVWTSTPALETTDATWVVAFFSGSSSTKRQQLGAYVRLVRYRVNADGE